MSEKHVTKPRTCKACKVAQPHLATQYRAAAELKAHVSGHTPAQQLRGEVGK